MAHPDISLMGAVYPEVPAIILPVSGGGTAQFDDTSDADAIASDITSGKTAYVNGVKLTGTGSGGGVTDIPNPNLLDNWYFVGGGSQQGGGQFPINQRKSTSYSTANAYTIDRWKLTSGSVAVAAGGITLNGTLVQILENAVGQSVTASVLFSDGTMGVPTYDDLTKTFTLTASGKTIAAAKLELGDTQTLAHQENGTWVVNEIPHFAEHLERCQRYLIEVNFIKNAYCKPGMGYASSSTAATIFIGHPTMRAKPSVSYVGSWVLEDYQQNYKTVSAMSVDTTSANGSTLSITASSMTAGRLYSLMANNSSTADIYLSADL